MSTDKQDSADIAADASPLQERMCQTAAPMLTTEEIGAVEGGLCRAASFDNAFALALAADERFAGVLGVAIERLLACARHSSASHDTRVMVSGLAKASLLVVMGG
jgi:hypothetical protein